MKALLFAPVLLFVISLRGDGQGPAPPKQGVAPPYRSWTTTRMFEADKRAAFVAIGSGDSFTGVYVYDDRGNCVAWDDQGVFGTRDDLAAVWYPPRAGVYTIEVCNLGKRRNVFRYSLRQ